MTKFYSVMVWILQSSVFHGMFQLSLVENVKDIVSMFAWICFPKWVAYFQATINYYYICLMAFFQDKPGKLAPER